MQKNACQIMSIPGVFSQPALLRAFAGFIKNTIRKKVVNFFPLMWNNATGLDHACSYNMDNVIIENLFLQRRSSHLIS